MEKPKKKAGQQPISRTEPTVIVPIRMTVGQKAKLALLGGAAWVRARINRAKEPE